MASNPIPAASGRHERLADLIEARRTEILTTYEKGLEASESPLTGDPLSRHQAIANAGRILTDVVASLRAGRVRVNSSYKFASWTIGETRASSEINPSDSLSAAVILFETAITVMSASVENTQELLPSFVLATLALNESINARIREATIAYTGSLLNRIHQMHIEERRRIARELHDRLGEGLSVALRQLELSEFPGERGQGQEMMRSAMAKQALTEAMRQLRSVIADLRQDPVDSLTNALNRYLDSIRGNDMQLRLRVRGDEAWASRMVLDESFLILREAVRNAITHGDPTMIFVGVDLAPQELHAWVDDDGHGFEAATAAGSGGIGLFSMRERAALLGGRVTVTSRPDRGTHVELLVPLLGYRDDPTG